MSNHVFSQVDADHAQEWIVSPCKDVSGGIVGITEDVRTLPRGALSLHWRSEIATLTFDRDFLHTFVVAYDAGRKVDSSSILKHARSLYPWLL
ncbi:hypothetical protein JTB14_019674 [Gonioctena quinquepunctata]|nr:hypothetical protein JTB14_019674 [Gonioctena quinquepunctata]